MFNSTLIFSGLIVFTSAGLAVAYLMRLLALSALEIIDTQNLGTKYTHQQEYISNLSTRLYRLYSLYLGTIVTNVGLLMGIGGEPNFLINIIVAAVNATTIVNMYNVNSEHKKFRDALKEVGMLVDETDED